VAFELEVEKRIEEAKELFANQNSFDNVTLHNLAKKIVGIFKGGNSLAFVGNGGSAAEAMHLAAEFTGKCVFDHEPLRAYCLNESQSAITAIANDYGIEYVFSRQVQAQLKNGDLLIALSTSGSSKNIVNAIDAAKSLDVEVILWMGDFKSPRENIEIWKVPSQSTPRIQEIHLAWGHIIAEIVELIIMS
jgi:D-sedoheptulose 7-phosphate isomerase